MVKTIRFVINNATTDDELTEYMYKDIRYFYDSSHFIICPHLRHDPPGNCTQVIISKSNSNHKNSACHTECVNNDEITEAICSSKYKIKHGSRQGQRTDLKRKKESEESNNNTKSTSCSDNETESDVELEEEQTKEKAVTGKIQTSKRSKSSKSSITEHSSNVSESVKTLCRAAQKPSTVTEPNKATNSSSMDDFNTLVDQSVSAAPIITNAAPTTVTYLSTHFGCNHTQELLNLQVLGEFLTPILVNLEITSNSFSKHPQPTSYRESMTFPYYHIFQPQNLSYKLLQNLFTSTPCMKSSALGIDSWIESLAGGNIVVKFDRSKRNTCPSHNYPFTFDKTWDKTIYEQACAEFYKSALSSQPVRIAGNSDIHTISFIFTDDIWQNTNLIYTSNVDLHDVNGYGNSLFNPLTTAYFIGSAGTQTAFHCDPSPGFSYLRKGRKLWFTFDIREAVALNLLKRTREPIDITIVSQLKSWRTTIQNENEWIYISSFCCHAVYSILDSIVYSVYYLPAVTGIQHLQTLATDSKLRAVEVQINYSADEWKAIQTILNYELKNNTSKNDLYKIIESINTTKTTVLNQGVSVLDAVKQALNWLPNHIKKVAASKK